MIVKIKDITQSTVNFLLTSTLVRSAGVYTTFRVVNSAIPFFLMPLLTRYLSPTDYGRVAMFSVLTGIVSPFVGLNLHGAVGIRYFDAQETNLPQYIGNCLWLLFISTFTVSIAVWLFSESLASATQFPRNWLWTIVLCATGQFVILLLLTLWQVEKKPVKFGIFQSLQTFLNVGLSIMFVVVLNRGWEGQIEAQVIVIAAFTLIAFTLLRRRRSIRFTLDRERIYHALKFGVPLIPHALGGIMITQTDRIFITNMVSINDTGIYTVGLQIAMIIELLSSSFHSAYVPWLYEQLAKNDMGKKIMIVKATYLYFIAILVGALILSLTTPWFLGFFVGKAFASAHVYTFWLAIGFAFCGMYYMVTSYIFYAGRTHILAWVTLFTAIINIALNYILIKHNGAVGAAQASAVAFFMSFILTWVLSTRVYKMPWNLKKGATNAADHT